MNELARRPLPHMTADEFLLWPGDGTRRRFHLVDGEVRAMSPASWVHGKVQSNLIVLLEAAATACDSGLGTVAEGAIVPALTASDNVRVPDVVVVGGEAAPGTVAVPGPVVVVELSPGNAPATRENVRAYATLASVREIVVVSTSRMEVEVHRRDESGAWPPEPDVIKRGGQLEVRAVGLLCAVERVYRGTWLSGPRP